MIPGTRVIRHLNAFMRFYLRYVYDGVMKLFKQSPTRSVQDGATDIVNLATADQYKGEFIGFSRAKNFI